MVEEVWYSQWHANTTNNITEIIYKDLSYKIVGICFKVHRDLGRFCRENQYLDRLELLLKESGVNYKREYEIINLNSNSPKGNRVDLLIEKKVILEAKAKKFITKEDYYQVQRYLQGANLKLGLIVNFRQIYLKPKRVINNLCHSY